MLPDRVSESPFPLVRVSVLPVSMEIAPLMLSVFTVSASKVTFWLIVMPDPSVMFPIPEAKLIVPPLTLASATASRRLRPLPSTSSAA